MGINGWPGWIALAAFVAFLALTGRLRPSRYVLPGPARSAPQPILTEPVRSGPVP
ncbi:hypothetical protein [Streptomyces sp. NPDC048644]|uniref:hypothetical protein n=1 Tax=Streptomyces sp. NPDC048644 TaxID=3365582 RepID=UPI00371A2C2B